jgi:hypothetical protein
MLLRVIKNYINMIEKSLMSGMFYFLKRKSLYKYAQIKIVQEINYNLRLIDMMEWSGVNDEFKLELCTNFKTDDMEYYLKFISLDMLNTILSQKPNISDENNIVEIPFSSAINKMESLKVLAKMNKSVLEENNRGRINLRIQNIREDLLAIKSKV